jgi:UDP-GlcNAc:undecaprenyl-phosphate/decaprenyl-phosphate GlcNAc-1-phosphate transferase
MIHKTYLVCGLLGFLTTFLVTPLVTRMALALGAVDRPAHRKVHARPTPLLGGLAIFLGMWLPLLFLVFYSNEVTNRLAKEGWHRLFLICMAGLSMLVLGIWDDTTGLNARWKFSFQIPLAAALVLAGVQFNEIGLPYLGSVDLGPWGPVLVVVWIVGITNALNLIDGIDGLATGVAFLVAATNASLAVLNGNPLLAVVMCSMAGACLGFLRYNFAPARIFLGDAGSLFLGITLAVTAIMANSKRTVATSMLVPVLVLGYPALDTLLAMFGRFLHGKSMFTGDRSHIHHRLVARGLGHAKSALVLYLVCALFCVVGVATAIGNTFLVGVGLATIALVFSAGVWALGYLKALSHHGLRQRPFYRIAYHYAEMTKHRLGVLDSPTDVLSLIRDACTEFGMLSVRLSLKESALGPACEYHWLLEGKGKLGFAATTALPGDAVLQTDEYRFDGTGFAAQVNYRYDSTQDELLIEYRALLGALIEAADRRLAELAARHERKPAPEVRKPPEDANRRDSV